MTRRWRPFSFWQASFEAPSDVGAWLWLALRVLLALVGLLFLLIVALGLAGALWTGSLQRVWQLQSQIEPIRVLDRSGEELGVLNRCDVLDSAQVSNPVRCRQSLTLKLSEMPRGFLLAYVAKEDVRYFQHLGVDPGRIPRSLVTGAGGSTIPMQLLKNNVLAGHFDYDTRRSGVERQLAGAARKATEYVLAPLLSLRYSKAQVLEMSVNSLPWLGIGQRRGLSDAARIMFGKRAADLSLAQSAFLVGLLPRPSSYLVMPDTPLEEATEQFRYMRQQQLLTLGILRQHGLIAEEEYAQAVAEPLYPSLWRVEYAGQGANLSVLSARRDPDYRNDPDPASALQPLIKEELRAQGISPARVATVTLALDAAAQRRLTAQLGRYKRAGVAQGAAIVDARGGILALASSTGGEPSAAQQQWAVTANRPVASTVKPLLYATAFGVGLTQLSRFPDEPTRYYGQQIHNNSRTFLGRLVTVREANARSLNTVAVRVGLRYEGELSATLQRVGYDQDGANRSSPALGTWRASPLKVAAAYASFDTGELCRPHLLLSVYATSGQRLPLPEARCEAMWSPLVTAETADMLRGAVTEPYSHVKFLRGVPFIGAKSGTTDNVQDSWCAGLTPAYAMSVWMGDPTGLTPLPEEVYQQQLACRTLTLLGSLPAQPPAQPPPGTRWEAGALVPSSSETSRH